MLSNFTRHAKSRRAAGDASWNVMAHAQKPYFVFRRNGRVHLNRRGRQFSRLLAAEVWASAVVMLDTPCSEVVWRVLATHSIRQFPLRFPSRASLCAITVQLASTCEMYHLGCVSVWSDGNLQTFRIIVLPPSSGNMSVLTGCWKQHVPLKTF